MKYRDIELVEEIDGEWYFEDVALAATHCPKGDEPAKMAAWMKREGMSHCTARKCLGKVLHGGSHNCGHRYGPRARSKPVCDVLGKKHSEWFDHSRMFWHPETRRYVLTAQPYGLSLRRFMEAEAFASLHGFALDISITDAWWYPGRTPLVVWRRAE